MSERHHYYQNTPEPGFQEELLAAVACYFGRLPGFSAPVLQIATLLHGHPDLTNCPGFRKAITEAAEIIYSQMVQTPSPKKGS